MAEKGRFLPRFARDAAAARRDAPRRTIRERFLLHVALLLELTKAALSCLASPPIDASLISTDDRTYSNDAALRVGCDAFFRRIGMFISQ
jgi:hypothetical protein